MLYHGPAGDGIGAAGLCNLEAVEQVSVQSITAEHNDVG